MTDHLSTEEYYEREKDHPGGALHTGEHDPSAFAEAIRQAQERGDIPKDDDA